MSSKWGLLPLMLVIWVVLCFSLFYNMRMVAIVSSRPPSPNQPHTQATTTRRTTTTNNNTIHNNKHGDNNSNDDKRSSENNNNNNTPKNKDTNKVKVKKPSPIVIYIPTAADESGTRSLVRRTWMTYHSIASFYRPFFVIGTRNLSNNTQLLQRLEREKQEMGDLWYDARYSDSVTGDKQMGFITWLVEEAKLEFRYLLKLDLDTFLRADVLANEVEQWDDASESIYYGTFSGFGGTVCNTSFDAQRRISFGSGALYMVSYDIARWLARELPQQFRWCSDLEDVRFGFWVHMFKQAQNNNNNGNSKKLVHKHGEFEITITDVRQPEEAVAFHYYQLKQHMQRYHEYLMEAFPADGPSNINTTQFVDMIHADDVAFKLEKRRRIERRKQQEKEANERKQKQRAKEQSRQQQTTNSNNKR